MRCLFATLSLTALVACAHPQTTTGTEDATQVRAVSEQNEARYAEALKRADAAAIAAFFAEDGQSIPGWQKGSLDGRTAIQAFNAKRLATTRFLDAAIMTSELATSGDVAYETGTNRLTHQTGDAAPVTTTGRYLTVWRRQANGQWLIQVDMVVVDPA